MNDVRLCSSTSNEHRDSDMENQCVKRRRNPPNTYSPPSGPRKCQVGKPRTILNEVPAFPQTVDAVSMHALPISSELTPDRGSHSVTGYEHTSGPSSSTPSQSYLHMLQDNTPPWMSSSSMPNGNASRIYFYLSQHHN